MLPGGHLGKRAMRRARARPCARPTSARHAAVRRFAVPARCAVARRRAAARARRASVAMSNGAQSAPSMPASASGWMPTGVASTGTSQASASSTARPKPSRSEGTSTALAALIQSGTRVGLDAAEREQLDVAGAARGAVEALLGPRGVGGEEQVGRVAREPELGARAPRARSGGSARGRRRTGSTCARRAARGPAARRASAAETVASEVDARQRGAGEQARARVAQVGAVERQRACARAHGQRGPGGQPEVRVDHVEALRARSGGAARGAAARARAGRAGTRSSSTSTSSQRAQRRDLVAHEAAALGMLGVGAHVRDHERAHACRDVALARRRVWDHGGRE